MKQVYKITYPNGKIYFGVDVTGIISYFGSPSDSARIEADLGTARTDFSIRKTILWGSNAASGREARAMETKLSKCGKPRRNQIPCVYFPGVGPSYLEFLFATASHNIVHKCLT